MNAVAMLLVAHHGSSDRKALTVTVEFRIGQRCQLSGQVGSAVQEIDDDHLLGVFNDHDEMLTSARKAQVSGKSGATRRRRSCQRAVPAAISKDAVIKSS